MTDPDVMRKAGEKLKKIRLRLGLSIREVERLSLELVAERQSPDLHLSRNWIASVERGRFFPGTLKGFTLSLILRMDIAEIHALYGFKPGDIAKEIRLSRLPKTHLIAPPAEPLTERAAPESPADDSTKLENASLSTRLVDIWGDVPVSLLRRQQLRPSLYGCIGMEDETMSPLLPPGTWVRIDVRQTHVKNEPFHKSAVRSPYARPIYFLDIRSGYACGWCQIENGILTLIPHPDSGVKTRTFRHPSEVEVVGRVTWIGVSLEDEPLAPSDESLRGRIGKK
jgi:transcriptional regulator with XRE-family HTH domain